MLEKRPQAINSIGDVLLQDGFSRERSSSIFLRKFSHTSGTGKYGLRGIFFYVAKDFAYAKR